MITIIERLLEEIGSPLAAVHTPLGLRLGLGRRPTVPMRSFLATGRHLGKNLALLQQGSWPGTFWFLKVYFTNETGAQKNRALNLCTSQNMKSI